MMDKVQEPNNLTDKKPEGKKHATTDTKPLTIYLKFSITLFIGCIVTGFLFIVILLLLLWFLLLVVLSLRPPTSRT
jgi:hypothetical protein